MALIFNAKAHWRCQAHQVSQAREPHSGTSPKRNESQTLRPPNGFHDDYSCREHHIVRLRLSAARSQMSVL